MINSFEKKFLIIYGKSRTYLDSIRYITNISSGLMGYELHQILLKENPGNVDAIVGDLNLPFFKLPSKRFKTNQELWTILKEVYQKYQYIINLAALNDYYLKDIPKEKINKDKNPILNLNLSLNLDIMSKLGQIKQQNQYLIGFSVQNNVNDLKKAKQKIIIKNLDLIIINDINTMSKTNNLVIILNKNGNINRSKLTSKKNNANFIWVYLQKLMNKK